LSFGEADEEQAILFGMAEDDLPMLPSRVSFVVEDGCYSGSSKTVLASSKLTPCFRRLDLSLVSSQPNLTGLVGLPPDHIAAEDHEGVGLEFYATILEKP
jgi:hypothetical protein